MAELKGDKKFRIKIYQKYVNFSSGLKWQLDYICNIYYIVRETVSNGRTHGAPYRGHGLVPLRFGGNVVMRMGTQQQNSILFELAGYQQLGARRCESWILSHEPLGKDRLKN